MLGAAMGCVPLWCRLLFFRILNKRQAEVEEEINDHLARLHPGERENAYKKLKGMYTRQGRLILGSLQIWSLIFIGWVMLFELFVISAWVRDLQLIWQPDWVEAAIDWVRKHTNTPPLHIDRDLFLLSFDNRKLPIISNNIDEQSFMYSKLGEAVLLFHFFRALLYFPFLIALAIVIWRPLDWIGFQNINPRYIDTARQFFWCSFLSIFLIFLILIFAHSMFWRDVGYRASDILGKTDWLSHLWLHVIQVFILLGIKMLVGWLFFWKQLIVSLFIKLGMKL